ncbi:hypothetical protein DERP_012590 [Dermatophagoides pteronyssinus]|uniref:Uncharacterized protein n=1 Tax=Dermatophagoides pteronyssinus TaxID=6956 RepID=A0ABQ8IUW6_DERPT|nr:hypothetical protein DERP_012590 [Dermatophagoides pteronyssinus]
MAKLIRSESDIATGAKAMNNNNKNFSSDGTHMVMTIMSRHYECLI